MSASNIIAVVGGIVAILATLGAGFISYGRLQTLVETQAATNARQSRAIETLTNDLHGFQDFFMDFLTARGVTTGPLDPDRYFSQRREDTLTLPE